MFELFRVLKKIGTTCKLSVIDMTWLTFLRGKIIHPKIRSGLSLKLIYVCFVKLGHTE